MEKEKYEFGGFVVEITETGVKLGNVAQSITVEWRFDSGMGMVNDLVKLLRETEESKCEWGETKLAKDYIIAYLTMLWHTLTALPDGILLADWLRDFGAYRERITGKELKEDLTDEEWEQYMALEHSKEEFLKDPDKLIDAALAEAERVKETENTVK